MLVDDLHAFQKLCPALAVDAVHQSIDGIAVVHWREPAHVGETLEVADVVVEAFGCELPPVLRRRDGPARTRAGVAEPRISKRRRLGRGFSFAAVASSALSAAQALLLPRLRRGHGWRPERTASGRGTARVRTSPDAREAWWRHATGSGTPSRETTVVSLFAYENPAVDSLLEQWRDSANPIVLLIPEGRISGAAARFFGMSSFAAGSHAERGNLTAHALSFAEQTAYDALLWASDINFVRGEDSFVRAQWAARPFVWQIYPQSDDVHLPKLDAALAHYARSLPIDAANALAPLLARMEWCWPARLGRFPAPSRRARNARGTVGARTGGNWRPGWKSGRLLKKSARIRGYLTAADASEATRQRETTQAASPDSERDQARTPGPKGDSRRSSGLCPLLSGAGPACAPSRQAR